MTISRILAFFSVFLVLAFVFCFNVSADSYTVYSSASESSVYNILADLYRQSDFYRPFADYYLFADSPNSYIMAINTPDSSSSYHVLRYRYDSVLRQYVLSDLGVDSSFRIYNPNDFVIFSSVSGSSLHMRNPRIDEFKFRFVILIFAFLFLIVYLFKSFKINFSTDRRLS